MNKKIASKVKGKQNVKDILKIFICIIKFIQYFRDLII